MEERRDFRSYIRPEKLNEETPEPKKKKRKMAGDSGPLGTVAHNIGRILLYYAVPFIGSLIGLPIMLGAYDFIIIPIFLFIFYHIISKKTCSDMNAAAMINLWIAAALSVLFAVLMVIFSGSTSGDMMQIFYYSTLPTSFSIIAAYVFDGDAWVQYFMAMIAYGAGFIVCAIHAEKGKPRIRHTILPLLLIAASVAVSIPMYLQRPEVRYAGHGFDYMHGYSSTDFTDYTVYADNSKLVEPDTAPSLLIEKEFEMPKMDGAEACYPLYSAFAKAVYKDIGKIEEAFKDDLNNYGDYCAHNGKIVTFTNTVVGFERLINCDVDLFFGARPSKSQLQDALDKKVQLNITPIGKEAFVFFVEEDNPVDSLTADQLRAIYHGDIENWEELGGNKAPIVAFQRPENSGSQTMMQYFMGKVELKQPMTYEMVGGMGGVIREVAQYANERGAIGYSFRYFVEGLSQEKGVKLLAVDGVYPTVENIENGSYPLTVDLCLITRKDDPNKNVGRMIDFILSPSGQEIIRKTGYAGLPEKSN